MAPQQTSSKNALLKHLANKLAIRRAIKDAETQLKKAAREPLKIQQALVRSLTKAVNAVLQDMVESFEDPWHNVAEEQLRTHDNNLDTLSERFATRLAERLAPEAMEQLKKSVESLELAIKTVAAKKKQHEGKPERKSVKSSAGKINNLPTALPIHGLSKSKPKVIGKLKRSVSYPERTNQSKPVSLSRQHSAKSDTAHSSKHHYELHRNRHADTVDAASNIKPVSLSRQHSAKSNTAHSSKHHYELHRNRHADTVDAAPKSLLHSASTAGQSTASRLLQNTLAIASSTTRGLYSIGRRQQGHQEADEAIALMAQAAAKTKPNHKTMHASSVSKTVHTSKIQPGQSMVSAQQLRRQRSIGQRSSNVDLQR